MFWVDVLALDVFVLHKFDYIVKGGVDGGFSKWMVPYAVRLMSVRPCSQYSLRRVFPTRMFSSQSLFHLSSLVERTLVMVGPKNLCAPEQFMQTKTPKSKDAQHGDLPLQSAHSAFSFFWSSVASAFSCCYVVNIIK